jgi:acetyltransferase EpsM
MKVAIIGHGGQGKVVKDLLNSFPEHRLIAFLDDRYSTLIEKEEVVCAPISFGKQLIEHFYDVRFIIAVGDNERRKHIFETLNLPNEFYLTLVHPKAFVSPSSTIGDGVVVMANAVVNAGAVIGEHAIINSGAIIEHDCKIGRFAHISPNATLTGDVTVEEGVHIGSGATLLPSVRVNDWSKIGAGATVLENIPSYSIAVGVPARVIREKKEEEAIG